MTMLSSSACGGGRKHKKRKKDPRTANGHARRQLRDRVKAMGLPCALCGRPIDYTLSFYIDPRDGKKKPHPMRYELDEILSVALGGDPLDITNVQPTHRICNQKKGAATRAYLQKTKSNPSVTTPIPHYADL